jgi:hypothetical protein
MDIELKNKWLAALRSGDYKQGAHRLRTVNDCFCCLGVLCDIINPDGWVEGDDKAYSYDFGKVGSAGIHTADISRVIAQNLGLLVEDEDCPIAANYVQSIKDNAIDMNDDGMHDFNAIADYLEGAIK